MSGAGPTGGDERAPVMDLRDHIAWAISRHVPADSDVSGAAVAVLAVLDALPASGWADRDDEAADAVAAQDPTGHALVQANADLGAEVVRLRAALAAQDPAPRAEPARWLVEWPCLDESEPWEGEVVDDADDAETRREDVASDFARDYGERVAGLVRVVPLYRDPAPAPVVSDEAERLRQRVHDLEQDVAEYQAEVVDLRAVAADLPSDADLALLLNLAQEQGGDEHVAVVRELIAACSPVDGGDLPEPDGPVVPNEADQATTDTVTVVFTRDEAHRALSRLSADLSGRSDDCTQAVLLALVPPTQGAS